MTYFVFILIALALACASWLKPRLAPVLGPVFLIIAILMAGLSSSSRDYDNYVNIFYAVANSSLGYPEKLFVGKDPIFGAIITIIQSVDLGVQWLFVIAVTLALWVKARAFLRVFGDFLTPLFVTVCLTYFLHEFTQIRVAVALGFGFMALSELSRGKRIAWAFYSAVAVGFHVSAFIFIALEIPFVLGIRKDALVFAWGIGILSVLFLASHALLVASNIEGRVAIYIGDSNLSGHMLILAWAKWVALTVMMWILTKGKTDLTRYEVLKVCYFMECVGVGVLLIFMDRASGFGFRVYEMLDAFSVFIVSAALLRRTRLSWGVAMSYCLAMVAVLSESKLLLPYRLANGALWW